MEGYKTYRHNSNPLEKIIHDEFVKQFDISDVEQIVFPTDNNQKPTDTLSAREMKLIITAIQWTGSPVGNKFILDCIDKHKENNIS